MVKANQIYKRIIAAAFILVLLFVQLSVCTFAADNEKTKKIVEVISETPEIHVELSANVKQNGVSGYVDGEKVKKSDVLSVNDLKSLTCFVIDNSSSMTDTSDTPAGLFESAKKEIGNLIVSKTDAKHVFMAYSFGKGSLKNIGTANSSDSALKLKKSILKLSGKEDATSLNDSLVSVFKSLQKQEDNYDSIRIVLITDQCGNFSTGAGENSIQELYKFHEIPLYSAILTDVTSSSVVNNTISLCDNSGAYALIVKNSSQVNKISNLYKNIMKNNIVSFETNLKDDGHEKTLKIVDGDGSNLEVSFKANRAKNSTKAVKAVVDEYSKEKIVISFDSPVTGANDRGNYKVIRNGKETIIPSSVTENEKGKKYTLNFDKALYSGEYSIEFENITDNSKNKNSVSKIKSQEFKNLKNPILKLLPFAIILVCVVLVLLAFYLILLNLKKKKNVNTIRELFETQVEETVEDRHYVQNVKKAPEGRSVTLIMQTADYPPHKVMLKVKSSFIFGRSSICDVYTDDKKLSRQHFAVEYTQGVFMIQDLNTTNGTFLNGIKVVGRQRVNSGDSIRAGLTNIRIEF